MVFTQPPHAIRLFCIIASPAQLWRGALERARSSLNTAIAYARAKGSDPDAVGNLGERKQHTPFSSLFRVGWYMWVLKSKRYPAASKWLRPERQALGGVQ